MTAGLAGGAALLLIEFILMILPPAICQGPAGASGNPAAAGDMTVTLPGHATAAVTLFGRSGACGAGQFTITIAISLEKAGLIVATVVGAAPRLPHVGLGQEPADANHLRWSLLQLGLPSAGPGSRTGAVRDSSGTCGTSGCLAVVQLLTSVRGETTLILNLNGQPPATCCASQQAARPTARGHP